MREAMKWYTMAAHGGDRIGQYNYAFGLLHGEGVKKDKKASFLVMRKSARQGYSEALADLGYYYMLGIGTKANYKKAFENYKLAAKKKVPRAHFNLGLMYMSGDGVTDSDLKAIKHFEMAVQLGHTGAYQYLAEIYLDKNSNEYNRVLGTKYKKKAYRR